VLGHAGEGWPGGNGGVNVFNAIEDGEVKGRVKEGVLMAGELRHEEAIRSTELDGGAAGVGRRGVGDGADSRGPLERERRERTRPARKARTKKENIFLRRRHRHMGRMGR
jgi:hypothetical protein